MKTCCIPLKELLRCRCFKNSSSKGSLCKFGFSQQVNTWSSMAVNLQGVWKACRWWRKWVFRKKIYWSSLQSRITQLKAGGIYRTFEKWYTYMILKNWGVFGSELCPPVGHDGQGKLKFELHSAVCIVLHLSSLYFSTYTNRTHVQILAYSRKLKD